MPVVGFDITYELLEYLELGARFEFFVVLMSSDKTPSGHTAKLSTMDGPAGAGVGLVATVPF